MHPALERLWNRVPRPVQDLVATSVDRLQGVAIPEPPFTSPAPVRLLIAPANYGGQGYRWARAVEGPSISARNLAYAEINPFGYQVDFPVRWRTVTHSRRWQRAQLVALTSEFTHVLVEAEFPPLGGMFGQDVRRQVAALLAGGAHVAMLCHGSDIRLPSRHARLEPWSPFAGEEWPHVGEVERVAGENRELLDDLALPTFVSTPGLLIDVPYAHLMPVVVDPAPWISREPSLGRVRPRVLHVPSNPLIKGTAQIEPMLRRLHESGTIEYIRVEGIPHADMAGVYENADIVLDQFRLGDYGVAACEAMAAGRLVISHVSEQARSAVRDLAGLRLPVLEATIDSLEEVLLRVVADRSPARAFANEGPAFVQTVHSGVLSRSVLEKHFLFA